MVDLWYLSVTSHIKYIVAHQPDERCLSHDMCLYQVIMRLHFLNNVTDDTLGLVVSSKKIFSCFPYKPIDVKHVTSGEGPFLTTGV